MTTNQPMTIGIDKEMRVHFRPNRSIMKPPIKAPGNAPNPIIDAIHEASSVVILPDGNGVTSDWRRIILGDVHPEFRPKPITNKFTV